MSKKRQKFSFGIHEAEKWLELRRHLVMLASASNDPSYVTNVMFHEKGYYLPCPTDKEPNELVYADFLTKDNFSRSAQCQGHWFRYFDYRQDIVKCPIELDSGSRLPRNIAKAKKIYDLLSDKMSKLPKPVELPEAEYALETVNHIDSYRYPSEVFLLSFDHNKEPTITNPKIILQITMPLKAQLDPSNQFLRVVFQTQYNEERFNKMKAIKNRDYLCLDIDTLGDSPPMLNSLVKVLHGGASINEKHYSRTDTFSKYPLGVVFKIKNNKVRSPCIVNDLAALALRMGAANVFFARNPKEWENIRQRLNSLKYNMHQRPIVGVYTEESPADTTTKQILSCAAFGATKIETSPLQAGLSGASVLLVRYYKNALPTNWKVLKVDNWHNCYNEFRRYQMFVEDRLSTVRSRFIPGPKVEVLVPEKSNKKKIITKEVYRAGIEYSLASTLVEDKPTTFADWIQKMPVKKITKIEKVIDLLFEKILVAWDISFREFKKDQMGDTKQMFQDNCKAKNSEIREPDRRSYESFIKEYIPDFQLNDAKNAECEECGIEKIIKDVIEKVKDTAATKMADELEAKKPHIIKSVNKLLKRVPLKNIQTLKICHGDLHARNILIDGQEAVWVIDFGHTGLHHALSDFVKLEYSIWWRGYMNVYEKQYPQESETLERILLDIEHWKFPSALSSLAKMYGGNDIGKYLVAIATIRKHAKKFCATELPGFGFAEYLTCLGLKCLAMVRYEPLLCDNWCKKANAIFDKAEESLAKKSI